MGKFKSVLVERKYYTGNKGNEREPDVARLMAAYIDLNPVRAKLVEGAEDWRWSGWSAALAGDKEAIAGLCDILHSTPKDWVAWAKGVYAEMVSERRSDIERLAAKARDLEAGARRTLLVKIPEFSRSLVIGEFEDPLGDGGGKDGRTRRSRVGQVHGVTVRMVSGNAR